MYHMFALSADAFSSQLRCPHERATLLNAAACERDRFALCVDIATSWERSREWKTNRARASARKCESANNQAPRCLFFFAREYACVCLPMCVCVCVCLPALPTLCAFFFCYFFLLITCAFVIQLFGWPIINTDTKDIHTYIYTHL